MAQNLTQLHHGLDFTNLNQSQQSQQCSDLDVFQILSTTLVSIAKCQQILQTIRQILVSDSTFTPMSLFRYLCGSNPNSSQLYRKNIVAFLDENNLVTDDKQTDQDIKKVLSKYGIKSNNGIQYTQFLNFIYPFNSGVLRDLLSNKIKKYPEMDKTQRNLRHSDATLTAFLLLIQQQIKAQKRLEFQLSDTRFPSKDRLKKAIKSVKNASQKTGNFATQKNDNVISMLQIRSFIKAFLTVQDHLFLELGRRLGITKSGDIPIQNIQNLLKKIKKRKPKQQNLPADQNTKQKSKNSYHCEKQFQNKYTKQQNFKDELYKQLANTLNAIKSTTATRARTPRAKSANRNMSTNKNKTPFKKQQQEVIFNADLTGMDASYFNIQNQGSFRVNCPTNQNNNVIAAAQKTTKQRSNTVCNKRKTQQNSLKAVNEIFKQFIEVFLIANRQIQKCKNQLAKTDNVDYISLFKSLDNGRGMIDAQGMRKFYIALSGISIDYDFQILINKFAQPQQKWLSYSEFAQIFKINTTKIDEQAQQRSYNGVKGYHQINGIRMLPQAIRLLAQIIYLTLEAESKLVKISRKLKRSEIDELFKRINVDSESKGFINYQQLKKYLAQDLCLSIPMIDLMALLKRLDKSKNGVVLKQQFLIL